MIEFNKTRFGWFLAIVLCLLCSGCKISGNVTDNGAGVNAVTVSITDGVNHRSATTDGNGYFVFDELPEGSYIVTPSKAGMTFEPRQRKVYLSKTNQEAHLTFDAFNNADPMQFYFGNMHSHTDYSDGTGTATEAFDWAKNTAGYDFYAITDHAWHLYLDVEIDGNWGDEWGDTQRRADEFTENGKFVGIRGFEWSHLTLGHICVWGTENYTTMLSAFNMSMFYDWLADRPEALAEFNHPGREDNAFGDFALEPDVTDMMCAIETGNKDDGNYGGIYLGKYHQALDKGWKVAPTNNQDNHSFKTNSHRTVVIAHELTRPAILEAMRSRRTYSSDDPNMKITFKYEGQWMGSEIRSAANAVTLTIKIEDDEPISRVQLITNGGAIEDEIFPAAGQTTVSWNPTVGLYGADRYFYVQVTEQNDNGDLDDPYGVAYPEQIVVSAPLWFTSD